MSGIATIMALLRGLHLATTLSLMGTAGFVTWMLPAASAVPDLLRRRLNRLWWISGVIALMAGAAWFALQSATIADVSNVTDVLASLPVVAEHTRYGTMLMVRLGLLLVAISLRIGAARLRKTGQNPAATGSGSVLLHYLILALLAAALGLQSGIGHAGATAGAIGDGLVLSEALHLLAAGLWLGALMPLWLSLRLLPPADAASVCERFSPIGFACVLVLAGTGFTQGLELIGSLPALFGTPYGHIALLKIALFLLALALATVNRLWLTERITAAAAGARRHLLVSVGFETVIGLAIVMAAAFLASTVPGVHQAPVWPFSWQFSLMIVDADPEFRQQVLVSLIAIGTAVMLMAAALLCRRFRLYALVVMVAAIIGRGPYLSVLIVEAYPTSFQTSPTGFSAASIMRGQTLFARNCVACHGPNGDGKGVLAASLPIKPADLTMPHIREHTDGEMFWWLTHGVDDPKGGLAMPGFGTSLSADDRWSLIDYVRAHAAGVANGPVPAFNAPVRAPGIALACDSVAASTMADLTGHVVHVVIGPAAAEQLPVPAPAGISTVVLAVPDAETRPAPGSCIAADPAAWNAYAVLADLLPDALPGAEFLVDPNGWLRAVQRPDTTGGWHVRDDLLAAIRDICAHPIDPPGGGPHEHHH